MFPCVRPDNFIALVLHVFDEAFPVIGIFQCVVDGLDEIQLPAIAPQSRLVLAGAHLLFPSVLFWRLQHLQPVRHADLIIDLPMPLEICGVLVQLFAVLAAHAVDHQMIMKMVCVQVCCHDYLKIWELLLRELHADGVDLLWRQPVLRREGLDEVIELSAIRFSELLFGCHHFQVRCPCHAVVSRHHPLVVQHGFAGLRHIFQHAHHRTSRLFLVAYCGEDGHYCTSRLMRNSFWQRSA